RAPRALRGARRPRLRPICEGARRAEPPARPHTPQKLPASSVRRCSRLGTHPHRTRELFLEHVGTVVPRDHRSSPGPDLPQRDLARRTGLQDLLPSMCMTSRWSPNPRSLYRRAELRSRGLHPRRLASDEFVEVIPGFLTPSTAPAVPALSTPPLQREGAPGPVIRRRIAAELLRAPRPRALPRSVPSLSRPPSSTPPARSSTAR